MIKRQLMTTTAAILISTAAFAQSNSKDVPSASPSAQQTDKSAPAPPTSNPSATTSTQSQVSTPPASAQTPSASATSQTQNTATDSSRTNQNSTATSGGSNNTSAQGSHQPATASQNQSGQPATNRQQSTNPPPSTGANQAQKTPPATGNSSNPSAQDTQQNAAGRTGSERTNVSVQLNDMQRTRVSESVSHLNVQPLTNVNFSVSVGTAIPRDVRLQQLPADVVELVPQYRGYNFVLVRDEIVIVDPSSYEIVATMPYSGRSTAAAPAPREQRKVTFSDRDRETVRKHVRSAPVERRTTESTVRTEIRRGERVPDSVEIEAFPDEIYRDAPTLREYRYIHRDNRTYIVEPQERRVIEEID